MCVRVQLGRRRPKLRRGRYKYIRPMVQRLAMEQRRAIAVLLASAGGQHRAVGGLPGAAETAWVTAGGVELVGQRSVSRLPRRSTSHALLVHVVDAMYQTGEPLEESRCECAVLRWTCCWSAPTSACASRREGDGVQRRWRLVYATWQPSRR